MLGWSSLRKSSLGWCPLNVDHGEQLGADTVAVSERRLGSAARFAAVEDELTIRFPETSRDVVHALVREAHRSLADARIQDFLPLLVQRIVTDKLAAHRGVSKGA